MTHFQEREPKIMAAETAKTPKEMFAALDGLKKKNIACHENDLILKLENRIFEFYGVPEKGPFVLDLTGNFSRRATKVASVCSLSVKFQCREQVWKVVGKRGSDSGLFLGKIEAAVNKKHGSRLLTSNGFRINRLLIQDRADLDLSSFCAIYFLPSMERDVLCGTQVRFASFDSEQDLVLHQQEKFKKFATHFNACRLEKDKMIGMRFFRRVDYIEDDFITIPPFEKCDAFSNAPLSPFGRMCNSPFRIRKLKTGVHFFVQ